MMSLPQLVEEILRHRRLYTAGTPEIADAAYDALELRLQTLAPDHPILQRVGAEVGIEGKVEHHIPMLSLAKTYEVDALFEWAQDRPVVGTWKIDGVSLSLVYQDGALVQAKTRGDGQWGEDVTHKVAWILDCHPRLPATAPIGELEIRGEVYCSEESFSHLLLEMEQLGLEPPSNPRNIVAGILGRKQHLSLARFFSFFAFDGLFPAGSAPFFTETAKYDQLQAWGFTTPFHETLRGTSEITAFLSKVREQSTEQDVGIDGAVLALDDLSLQESLGATSHHPRYKLAFKWQGESAVSRICGIVWATSRLGIVTPVAQIDPVQLSGATISNVTLHNAAYVKGFHLKVGDRIELVRSGEVIPKFLRVVESHVGECSVPMQCPSCHSALRFDEVRLLCENATCVAQQFGLLLNWIRCVGIDDLSEKRLQQLMDHGLVQTIADLYRLRKEDLLQLPLTQEKMATKILANIDKTRSLSTAKFLSGLGIGGMGIVSWEKVLLLYPTLAALQAASEAELAAIKGFAEKSAQQIVAGLQQRKGDIEALLAAGLQLHTAQRRTVTGPLLGQSFVITGTLTRPRQEIESAILAAGGKVASKVTSKTTALILEDLASTSSKAQEARALGIPLWREVDLWAQITLV